MLVMDLTFFGERKKIQKETIHFRVENYKCEYGIDPCILHYEFKKDIE